MSIQTPTWSSIQLVGRPVYSEKTAPSVFWQRFPLLIAGVGLGFGEGGFGQGGFGAIAQQGAGIGQPIWSSETTK